MIQTLRYREYRENYVACDLPDIKPGCQNTPPAVIGLGFTLYP